MRNGGLVRVAVLGESGYVGGELVRLLADHPPAESAFLGGRDAAGRMLAEVHPHLGSTSTAGLPLPSVDVDEISSAAGLVLASLPHGTAAEIPKLESGVRAIEAGVGRVHLVDGRVEHAVVLELFTPEGVGTMITPDEAVQVGAP